MFFPRKIAEARANVMTRGAVEAFAAKVRDHLLADVGNDLHKLLTSLGGKIEWVPVAGRKPGEDDFLIARSKNDFTVGIVEMNSTYTGESHDAHDCAKAIGHMLMHFKLHARREGDGVAMVVQRYPQPHDLNATDVTNEGNWFAWALQAPVGDVARAHAELEGSCSKEGMARAVARKLGVSVRTAQAQIKRAIALHMIPQTEEAA